MASADMTMPQTRRTRARKSLAAIPSAAALDDAEDKENLLGGAVRSFNGPSKNLNKKTRSKSLGPGGLAALDEERNAEAQAAALAPLRSILKPTLPLSPLREIPARKAAPITASPLKSPSKLDQPLIDVSIPRSPSRIPTMSGSPRRSPVKSPRRQLSAEEQKRRDDIKKRRDERRKSMAGRRVSFAPEATLHTWDMVYDVQEQTNSSNDSTRRESGIFSSFEGDDLIEQASRRRRNSGVPSINYDDQPEMPSSPFEEMIEDSSTEEDEPEEDEAEENAPGEAENEGLEDTALEAALRAASDVAGTKGIEYDDNGDVSMELVDGDEATAALRPWVMQNTGLASPHPGRPSLSSLASPTPSSRGSDGDLSMDLTTAVGRVIMPGRSKGARVIPSRRQSMARRRRSSGGSSGGELSMDMTAAVGGIQKLVQGDEDENMSMELTTVIGGVRGVTQNSSDDEDDGATMEMTRAVGGIVHEDDTSNLNINDETMEMTQAIGRIIPAERVDEDEMVEATMDVTKAFGRILPTDQAHDASEPTDVDIEQTQTVQYPVLPASQANEEQPGLSHELANFANGSPVASSSRRTSGRRSKAHSPSPSTPTKQLTPRPAKASTPSKTPPSTNASMRNSSPKKLFQAEIREAQKSRASGKTLFQQDALSGLQTPHVLLPPDLPASRRASGVGADREGLGSARLSQTIGRRQTISEQHNSPSVERSDSRGVHFENPQAMAAEIGRELEVDQRRESGQFILEQEVNGVDDQNEDRDATVNLKDLISSMTPKKGRVAGRKSLAVGAARGVLGKRPAELDYSDDDDNTSRSLRGRETSPIKKIRLGPHSQPAYASSNLAPSPGRHLRARDPNERPHTPNSGAQNGDNKTASTPKSQGRFKDAEKTINGDLPIRSFGDENAPASMDEESNKIALQDFLNLSGIKFMDLTTTKRRPTVAPPQDSGNSEDGVADPDKLFEESVVAGACTIPMLDMFSHSCRELKKYIAEGRAMVRDFEAEVMEENPALFRVYQTATPEERSIMDTQFKNAKTHARLSSKGMWYEWRMKLLEGIQQELNNTASALKQDEKILESKTQQVAGNLPQLRKKHADLKETQERLTARLVQLKKIDPEELHSMQTSIASYDQEISEKKKLLADLERQSQKGTQRVAELQQTRVEFEDSIRESQRIREQCREWSAGEVASIKDKLEALERRHGWRINATTSKSTLDMTYRDQLQLFFDVSAFQPAAKKGKVNAQQLSPMLSLSYIGDEQGKLSTPQTTEKRFFLQLMRAHLHSLPKAQTHVRDVLRFVSSAWNVAMSTSEEIRRLSMLAPTQVRITGDEQLEVAASIILPSAETKIVVRLEIQAVARDFDLHTQVSAEAQVRYGEEYREDKMRDFLQTRVAGTKIKENSWATSVAELRRKLVAQGKKI